MTGCARISSFCLVLPALAFAHAARAEEPLVLTGHENVVSAVAFSPDGEQLISGGWDKTVRVWDARKGGSTATLRGHDDWVLAVVAAADGDKLLSASPSEVRSWNRNTLESMTVHSGPGGASVNSVAIASDGNTFATGGRDGTVKLWHLGEPSPVHVFSGFKSWVSSLSFTDDDNRLAAGTRIGRIRLLDLTGGKDPLELDGHGGQMVTSLAGNPHGDQIASGGYDQAARIWDTATGRQDAELTGHKGVVTAVAWSPDGALLATGERHGTIKVWNAAGGNRLIATLPGHTDERLGFSVTALAFSPDGRRLASGSYDKTIKVWRIAEE